MRPPALLLAACLLLLGAAALLYQGLQSTLASRHFPAPQTGPAEVLVPAQPPTSPETKSSPRPIPVPTQPVVRVQVPAQTVAPAAGPAATSRSRLFVPQFASSTLPLHQDVAVQMVQVQMGRTQVALLKGGLPVSRHVLWRSSVGEFVRLAGAVAGVNGTFFKDAAIASNDSNMLGPMLTPDGHFLSESDPTQLRKIGGRPLVAWSHTQFLVTAFDPGHMNHRAEVQALLPGVTDAFLAGAWLVHGGHALTLREMAVHAPKDAQEVRPRVFFGVTRDGLSIAGATVTPVSSERLAQIAEKAGAQEAVLMDSGYSTSLIYGSRVLAVGHRTRKVPSRPVPHAIVFMNPVLGLGRHP
jgi:Phosphodiester glycosidase